MKRLLITSIILGAAAALFCWSYRATTELARTVAEEQSSLRTRVNDLERLRSEQVQINGQVEKLKNGLAAQRSPVSFDELARKIVTGTPWKKLSPAELERLRAELGFDWNSGGDYVFISKQSLDNINYGGFHGNKLSSAAQETLTITAQEKADIEGMAQQISSARADWVKQHIQRVEPSGNVVAQYSLPNDSDFSQSQLGVFTNGLVNVLGPERAAWLQNHSQQWMNDDGLFIPPDYSQIPAGLYTGTFASKLQDFQSQPTTLKVERYQSGDQSQLNFTVNEGGGSMSTTVTPQQSFPQAFRAAFPGGWTDLAAREGFDLPDAFKKK